MKVLAVQKARRSNRNRKNIKNIFGVLLRPWEKYEFVKIMQSEINMLKVGRNRPLTTTTESNKLNKHSPQSTKSFVEAQVNHCIAHITSESEAS